MNNTAKIAEFSANPRKLMGRKTNDGFINPTNKQQPQHSAWRAFQAGMQILQNYAGRSPANSETIAKANLRLLHRSLLSDPRYVQSLKNASNKEASNSFPISRCIFHNDGLRADLITLKSGTTIQINPQQNICAMYLSIIGKPSIHSSDSLPLLNKRWWNRYCHANQGVSLKNGDSMFVSPMKTTKNRLTAEKDECILLRIQLPNR
jgi:hypothetical protein